MTEPKLEDLAFSIEEMRVLGKSNLTERGHILAIFTMKTARFSVCNVRLFIDWNKKYDVSFSLERQVSFLTINHSSDREELIRVAARAYQDKRERSLAYKKQRAVQSCHAKASAELS